VLIHEAIQQTDEKRPFIARKSWFHKFLRPDANGTGTTHRIIPTDSPSGCILLSPMEGCKGSWTPTKEDLQADDWFATI